MSRLLIKFPTRNRRNVFLNTFDLYYNMLSGKHDFEFRISMDADDHEMNSQDLWEYLDSKKNITYCYGDSKCKVEAINANMHDTQFDVVLLASDDMVPKEQGYDDIIMQAFERLYPAFDGAVWFNDGRVGNSLCTLSIMGKKLYDRFGYIYHPDYKSLFCDNEFHEVCHSWSKMTYVDRVIIQHAWVDATGVDELHRRNESLWQRDQRMYELRKANNFPQECISAKLPDRSERIMSRRRRRVGV